MHFAPWNIFPKKTRRIPVNQYEVHERILSTTQHNRLILQQSKKWTREKNNNPIEQKSYERLQV